MVYEFAILILVLAIIVMLFIAYRFSKRLVKMHNKFTYYREDAEKWAANLDIQLEKQYDNIDSMSRLLRQYDQKEYDFVKDVTLARRRNGTIFQKSADMEMAMQKMYKVIEQTPQITSTPMYKELNQQIRKESDEVASAKRKYISAASSYNKRISMIPYSHFAKKWGFEKKELFQTSADSVEKHREGMGHKTYHSQELFGNDPK